MHHFNDQYKDPRWHERRKEIYRRDKWHCRACNKTNIALDVHHLYYEMGLKIWEYESEALVTLCRDCHAKIHIDLKKISGIVAFKILTSELDLIHIDEKLTEIMNYY